MSGKRPRSYLLVLQVKDNLRVKVGSLGWIKFEKGIYTYVGSAKRGIESRLKRHLRKRKVKHWHIDYLLEKASIVSIWVSSLEEKDLVEKISSHLEFYARGFGASDSTAPSHLFKGKPVFLFNSSAVWPWSI